jgi:predicted O-methyltransferase YrrM
MRYHPARLWGWLHLQRDKIGMQLNKFAKEILAIPTLPEMAETEGKFLATETKSMLSPKSRAFMFHLIQKIKPELVLEIGTFFAGTSRVIADSLVLNGTGSLVTLDPDAGRMPIVTETIGQWPADQREVTNYVHILSDDFFIGLRAMPEIYFDLMFVDGDHRHRAALGDLLACSDRAAANSVVVVDDYDQPNVFLAVQDFLKIRPDWQEISGNYCAATQDAPFKGMKSSFEGIPILVLLAPASAGISERASSYSLWDFSESSVTSVDLSVSPDQSSGTLFAHAIFDSVSANGVESVHRSLTVSVKAGSTHVTIPMDPPLTTDSAADAYHRTCEVSLVWRNDSADEALRLNSPPVINTA